MFRVSLAGALLLAITAHATVNVCTFAANDPNRNNCVMGWATQSPSGPVTGGDGADSASIYTVTTRAQLWTALGNNKVPKDSKRIVYVSGTIRGDDLGNGKYADSDYYRSYPTANEFYLDLYLTSFDSDALAKLKSSDATKYALAIKAKSELSKFQVNQQLQIAIKVPSHTTIIGLAGAKIQGIWFRVNNADNVIMRNLDIEAPRDLATTWDEADGFNAEYDAITVEGSTRVWMDHLTLSDGRYQDQNQGTFKGKEIQYHDGLLDVKSASDYVTISHCVIANHSKTDLFGSSDSATGDEGHLRITLFKNYFYNTISRTPRARFGKIHVLSNLYQQTDRTLYFIGLGYKSSIFSQNNMFETSDTSLIVEEHKGTIFYDSASFINGAAAGDAVNVVAKKKVSGLSTTLGWTVPYKTEVVSTYATLKAEVLANAGAGKITSGGSASCTATKTCPTTQQCGSIWDGCMTVTCGTCGTGYSCNGTVCKKAGSDVVAESSAAATIIADTSSETAGDTSDLDVISEWAQVSPNTQTTSSWQIVDSNLVLKSLDGVQRIVTYVGAQTSWMSAASTTVSVNVNATEGEVGIGLRLGQGTGRTLDRLSWVLKFKSAKKVDTMFCRTQYGVEKCVDGKTGVSFTQPANFTFNIVVGSKYINAIAYLGSKKLTSSTMTVGTANFSTTGKVFLITKGSAAKSFSQLTIRSSTAVHVALKTCMTTSAWNKFVTKLLGIASVDSRAIGSDAKCSSRRDGELTFAEFETMIPDNEILDTPSSSLTQIFQDAAITDGAASAEGVSISSMGVTVPTLEAGIMVDTAAAAVGGTAAATLSTGAIVGIAVGGGVAAVAAVGAVTTGIVVGVRKGKKEDVPMESGNSVVRQEFKAAAPKGGVNVMDPEKEHASITNRGAPMAL